MSGVRDSWFWGEQSSLVLYFQSEVWIFGTGELMWIGLLTELGSFFFHLSARRPPTHLIYLKVAKIDLNIYHSKWFYTSVTKYMSRQGEIGATAANLKPSLL